MIVRVGVMCLFSPVKRFAPIRHLTVIFGYDIVQVLAGDLAQFIRYLQKFGKIRDSRFVLFGDRITASSTDQAFLIILIQGQCARIVYDGRFQAAFNLVDFTQIKIRGVTVRMAIGRVYLYDLCKGFDRSKSIGLVETFSRALFGGGWAG